MAGLLQSAARRSRLALRLLDAEPNFWLKAVANNTLLAIAFLRSDVENGLALAKDAADSAYESGAANSIRAAVGNLGNLYLLTGDFQRAADNIERALRALRPEENSGFGLIDALARIRLNQNRLDDCEMLLDSVSQSIRTEDDRTLYAYRHSLLTRTELLIRKDKLADALACADRAVAIARHCGDELLLTLAQLTRADILSALGERRAAALTIASLAAHIQSAPPSVRGEYHRVLACASLREGRALDAEQHAARAVQTFTASGNRLGVNAVRDSLARARRQMASAAGLAGDTSASAATLHAVAELFAHAAGPRTDAVELSNMIDAADAAVSVAVADESRRVPARLPHAADRDAVSTIRTDDRAELTVESRADIRSVATLNAVATIAAAVRDVRAARAAAERQAAVWPVDADSDADLNAVLVGHMQEQAALVRKVARTTVIVLVLGDSGTGKEILARAIHLYSDRAPRPFVPVNCAAVPAHLLESTLFGYRRGAFTGADRDNPGLIRAAAGGTLFLDEIGELGLDLQPKLLRFLESSEVTPLGDQTTVHVDVRIVCATNRNLAKLVQQGSFREDLFYRINVVRLELKPLRERRDEIPRLVAHFVAAAAQEFGKGYVPVAEETMERLLLYRWPGNIRQLQNEVRRMVALVPSGATLEPDMISDEILDALPLVRPAPRRHDAADASAAVNLPSAVAQIETEMIKAALREHNGRVDAVAKALGISRKGLYLKRQRLGV